MNTRTLGTGTWISVGAPVITEAVAGMGFDWLLIDLEHGSMTEADLLPNLHAAAASGVKVIVRIGEFRRRSSAGSSISGPQASWFPMCRTPLQPHGS